MANSHPKNLSTLLDQIESADPFEAEALAEQLPDYEAALEQDHLKDALNEAAESLKKAESAIHDTLQVTQSSLRDLVAQVCDAQERLRSLVLSEVERMAAAQREFEKLLDGFRQEHEKLRQVINPEVEKLVALQASIATELFRFTREGVPHLEGVVVPEGEAFEVVEVAQPYFAVPQHIPVRHAALKYVFAGGRGLVVLSEGKLEEAIDSALKRKVAEGGAEAHQPPAAAAAAPGPAVRSPTE